MLPAACKMFDMMKYAMAGCCSELYLRNSWVQCMLPKTPVPLGTVYSRLLFHLVIDFCCRRAIDCTSWILLCMGKPHVCMRPYCLLRICKNLNAYFCRRKKSSHSVKLPPQCKVVYFCLGLGYWFYSISSLLEASAVLFSGTLCQWTIPWHPHV